MDFRVKCGNSSERKREFSFQALGQVWLNKRCSKNDIKLSSMSKAQAKTRLDLKGSAQLGLKNQACSNPTVSIANEKLF